MSEMASEVVSEPGPASEAEPVEETRAHSASHNGRHSEEPHVERAEQVMEDLGKKFGSFVAIASTKVRKAAAIAKEEAEDFWAEVQSIRKGHLH